MNRVGPAARPQVTVVAQVTVVGMGADGWAGMPEPAHRIVETAPVVVGSRRHLDLLPEIRGQRRRPWPAPLRAGLPALLAELGAGPWVALASGDPLVSGIGTTLVDVLGAAQVRIVPAVSSVALARAELGWPAETCAVVSLVGRDPALVLRELAPGRRVLVLSSDEHTPAHLAELLSDSGYHDSTMHVLGDLGSPRQSRADGTAGTWTGTSPRLNVIGLELRGPHRSAGVAGLPDDAYEHDGQLTKRDLRASALARLAPAPGEHLWDVGAGAGSIGIEWMRSHPACTATAVEADPARAARIARNAARLGVPGLRVVTGPAPGALAGLPTPDAVFIGGGVTEAGVLDAGLAALAGQGRLVAHAVTVEAELTLAAAYRERGGELTRIGVETAAPLGSFTGWTPARTVTQWTFTPGVSHP